MGCHTHVLQVNAKNCPLATLLYLLIGRHLDILKVAMKKVLHPSELEVIEKILIIVSTLQSSFISGRETVD